MGNSDGQGCLNPAPNHFSKIPVTIVTGFLGSGKTTLLNHILNHRQGLKIAVIVNEFGDIDIDSQLLVAVDEDMVQLANGCICCTIDRGLVDAVKAIASRAESVDYLVIETTGIADPLTIVRSFIATDLFEVARVDSVLTVVDASSFTIEHYGSEAALNQLRFGDIILVNKTDLVSSADLINLTDYVRSIAPNARIFATDRGRVPLPLIIDVGVDRQTMTLDSSVSSHEHSHHLLNDGFGSVSFASNSPLILARFQNFLDRLSPDVYRAKGILKFQGSQLQYVLQMSGKRSAIESIQANSIGASRSPPVYINRLVFIGRNFNAEVIRTQLTECLAI
jgi:G3E family GTPase